MIYHILVNVWKLSLIEIPKYLFERDKNIIVGTIYHHPGTNLDEFYNRMEEDIIRIN